jgi:conjugative element/phage-associated large polyvalent protein
MSDFTSILDEEERRLRADADAAAPGSPYDAVLDAEVEQAKGRLNSSLNISVGANPDAAARQAGLAAKTGLPQLVVEENEERVAQAQRVRELRELVRISPVLARQLSDPNFAKIAHDEAENLSLLEQVFSWRKKAGAAMIAGVSRTNAGLWGVAQASAEGISNYLTGPLGGEYDPMKPVGQFFAKQRKEQTAFAEYQRRDEDKTSLVEQGVLGGVESFVSSTLMLPLALLTGNPNAALIPMAAQTGGQEFGKARDVGKGYNESLLYSASQAVVEYATEKLPLGRLMGDLKTGTPFWKLVLRQAAVEIPGEQLATVLQDLNEWAVLNPEKPFSAYLAERPSAAAQTLISTIVSVGGQTTVAKGVQLAVDKFGADIERADAADRDQQFLKELEKLAKASKLRERSPDTFAQFVQAAAEDGEVTDVYVNAPVLMQTLEQLGVRVNELPSVVVEQLADAVAAGGDVRIPVGEYSAKIAAHEQLGPALLPHLKTTPEAMSQAEAEVFYQQQAKQFKQQAETILREQEQNLELQQGAEAVKQHFVQELAKANRFTPQVNEAYATLVRDFYVTTAQRLGITPQEMLARYPLRVAVENVAADVVMDQQAPALAALRERGFDTSRRFFHQTAQENVQSIKDSGFDINRMRARASDEGVPNGVFFKPTEKDIGVGAEGDKAAQIPVYIRFGNVKEFSTRDVLTSFLRMDEEYRGLSDEARRYDATQAKDFDALWNERGALERTDSNAQREAQISDQLDAMLEVWRANNEQRAAAARERATQILKAESVDTVVIKQDVGSFKRVTETIIVLSGEQVALAEEGDNRLLFQGGFESDVGHKREIESGRYVGAPEWIGTNPQGIVALRAKLRKLALEGTPGRHWYENSSKAIFDLVGGDKVEAEKLVALIAIYSPNATVPANTSMALTAYFQFKAGKPIDAGFGAADTKATELLVEGKMWSGIKTNSFYQNLMVEIDAAKLEEGVATMDMWMAMAFDYGMKALDQGPKYQFAQREIQRLAAELDWPAHQVQAAIWTAIKARVDPIRGELKKRELKKGIGKIVRKDGEEHYVIKPERRAEHFHLAHELAMKYELKPEDVLAAKYDFADAIEGRLVQVSWEATPGESTGVLPGIHGAPLEQKLEYLDAVAKALTDENGRDLLAEAVGLPQGTTLFGYSAWQGAIGAGAQTFIAVPSEGAGKARRVKEAPRELLNQYAALKGYVMAQEAVVWHQPVYDDAQIRHNGVDILGSRPLTEGEMRALYEALNVKFGTWDIAPGYTQTGARLLNFVDGLDNKKFQKGVKEVLAAMPDGFAGGAVETMGYRSDGEYISNNWQEDRDGESYRKILETGRPDLLKRADELRARVETVNERFGEKFGWDRAPITQQGASQEAEVSTLEQSGKVRPAFHLPDGRVVAAEAGESVHAQIWKRLEDAGDPSVLAHMEKDGWRGRWGEAGSPIDGFVNTEGKFLTRDEALAELGFSDSFDVPQDGALEQPARGQIAFGNAITSGATITLLKNADLSTFLHESGHFFLEVMVDLASQPDAPVSVVEDMQRVLRWFGVKDIAAWRAMTLGEKRPHHEKFARGFEAYLFEGKAPSLDLQSLFSRFRAWLINVYKSLAQLDVELTSEVRGVLDRMLASEEQIKIAEAARGMAPLFKTPKEAAASAAEWQSYQALGAEATEDAVRSLERASLADLKWVQNARSFYIKELQALADDRRKAIRAEVAEEVAKEPIYQAMTFLRGKTKLSLPAMKEMYGEEANAPWRYFPTGEHGLAAVEGVHPNTVAEQFGFSSGDELVRKLLATDPMKSAIDGITDQRMLERYGDLVDEAAVARAADKAIHNDARARFVATELRFLSRVNAGSVNILTKAAKDFAQQILARRKIRDIRPNQFTAAEARAARNAESVKNPQEKAVEKRNQLVNLHAARVATAAVEEIERKVRYLKKFDREGTRANLDSEYLDQIDQLLERFDLKAVTQRELKRRAGLNEFIEAQREAGFEPTIDKQLLAEASRQHYSTLTLEEFRGLVEAIENIEHLARLKKKLLTAKDEREFKERVTEAAESIRMHATGTVPERRASDRGPAVNIARLFRGFAAEHRKFSSLVREMDAFKDGGVMWELFSRTMNEAGDAEASMREKATVALAKLLKPILKGGLSEKTYIPAVDKSFTREERIGIALNMGNEVNRERVLTGEKWSPAQLNAVMLTLTKPEWDFVQSVWDYLESWRPQIAEKTKRVTGSTPEWVEPQAFITVHGNYRGGYYPIKYDPLKSSKSEADDAAAVQRQMERGLYVRATTRRGHLEERVKSTGRPMRYDFGNILVTHVDQVAHDLAWHEWLIDANRLLRAPAIDSAIREHYGPEKLAQMRDMLRDIAMGELPAQDHFERVVNHLRHGATIVGLGWNVVTSLLQPFGLTQSMVRIGPKWVGKGFNKWLGDATFMENSAQQVYQKSEFMRLRGKTMQREINEIRNKVAGHNSALEASFFFLIQKMQLVADMPTWHGMYEKAWATEADMSEEKAIALADQAVRDSQGSGHIGDLAAIQRGSAFKKLWTNFYSFFNTTYNLTVEKSKERLHKGGPAQIAMLAGDYLLLFIIPSVLGTLLKEALKWDADDEEELAGRIVRDQLNYLLGLMIGVRETSAMVQGFTGYSGPAGTRFFAEFAKLGKQIGQGEVDEAALKAAANVAGIFFHLPAGQVGRTLDGIHALVTGATLNPGALLVGSKENN